MDVPNHVRLLHLDFADAVVDERQRWSVWFCGKTLVTRNMMSQSVLRMLYLLSACEFRPRLPLVKLFQDTTKNQGSVVKTYFDHGYIYKYVYVMSGIKMTATASQREPAQLGLPPQIPPQL